MWIRLGKIWSFQQVRQRYPSFSLAVHYDTYIYMLFSTPWFPENSQSITLSLMKWFLMNHTWFAFLFCCREFIPRATIQFSTLGKNYMVSLKGANEIIYLVCSRKWHLKISQQMFSCLHTKKFVDMFVVDFACTKAISNKYPPFSWETKVANLHSRLEETKSHHQ